MAVVIVCDRCGDKIPLQDNDYAFANWEDWDNEALLRTHRYAFCARCKRSFNRWLKKVN